MADEKKPKIDLKARLGKTAAPANAPTPAPAPVAVSPSGRPVPMPAPSQPVEALGNYGAPASAPVAAPVQVPGGLRVPTPMPTGGIPGLPGLPGLPVPNAAPSGFDASNPLASAVAAPYQQSYQAPRQVAAPEPQRIEFDDLTLQQATKGARKQGIIIGAVFAVILGGVGYGVGGASQQASDRAKAKEGAVDLAAAATKARDQLKTLSDKMEAGRKQLMADKKFPDSLARDLGAINVDFDGKQLEGRRFSGFSPEATRDLVAFITSVQSINDRKLLIQGLLTKLQKPITEQLASEGQIKLNYVVAVQKDPSGNVAGFLSRLVEPIGVTATSISLPPKFTFVSPGGGGNADAPNYTSGDLASKPAAIYVVPKSFENACPSATSGQIGQLGAQIGSFIGELKGEASDPNIVSDAKAGLIERADKLIKELGAVGN